MSELLAERSLRWLSSALNHSGTHHFALLRKARHGPALAAVAKTLASGGVSLLNSLALGCRWPAAHVVPGSAAAGCSNAGDCSATALRSTLLALNTELQRCARGVVRLLCRLKAPPPVIALVAALDAQATHYPSVTTECITLGASLDAWAETRSTTCMALYDPGMQCAHSLFQAAHLSAAALRDFLQLAEDSGDRTAGWKFVWTWGSRRVDILEGLLDLVAVEAPASTQRMAEVGVFLANTSVALLERFPNLHALLVDPYHAHGDSHEHHFQMLEEFYVSRRETFLAATEWTQPFRGRATHVLQRSREAAAWVAPGSSDLVFIDGDHRYESVASDIHAWWPAV